jgi:ATP-dependent helicase/nuclease subunit B
LILAGLNEGVWPAAPGPDPWLNRALRDASGLRLPDRVIGLSAHDFQQAVAAPEVWLCRARRDAETDTVPIALAQPADQPLNGASEESKAALEDMTKRGAYWVRMAEALLRPEARSIPCRARRPRRPPPRARPRSA